MWMLRTVMSLALIVWIGGIIFFAFVIAPTLFSVLPAALAGNVVSPTLTKLHWIGLFSGGIFLLCSLAYDWAKHSQLRLFSATHILIALMLLLTAVSQFAITPRMRALRQGPSGLEAPNARAEFNRLHMWSTRTEGGVLLLGLVVVILTARRAEGGSR
jgi:Domain of unknown function (DUF4149)